MKRRSRPTVDGADEIAPTDPHQRVAGFAAREDRRVSFSKMVITTSRNGSRYGPLPRRSPGFWPARRGGRSRLPLWKPRPGRGPPKGKTALLSSRMAATGCWMPIYSAFRPARARGQARCDPRYRNTLVHRPRRDCYVAVRTGCACSSGPNSSIERECSMIACSHCGTPWPQ